MGHNLSPQINKISFDFCYSPGLRRQYPYTIHTAKSFARAYATYVIARHVSGSISVTDYGRQFTSALFKETCKILRVRHMYSSTFDPQSKGKIERYHKTEQVAQSLCKRSGYELGYFRSNFLDGIPRNSTRLDYV